MEGQIATFAVKKGLAQMLKGGVIMDVVTPEHAKIAEDAGACAVMALERVPADIRADGGVARMSDPELILQIMDTVSIPVMAKCRIGHFVEAQILEAIGVDYIDESEVLTPADEAHHINKHAFKVPFVCGCRNLGEALRRIGRRRSHDPHQGWTRAEHTLQKGPRCGDTRSASERFADDRVLDHAQHRRARPKGPADRLGDGRRQPPETQVEPHEVVKPRLMKKGVAE